MSGSSPGMDPNLARFIDGVSSDVEDLQVVAPDGDPQATALRQYLKAKGTVRLIVDFGAGRGVLANLLLELWPTDPPEYWAVDLEAELDALALPRSLHNVSKKYTLDEFYQGCLRTRGNEISVVIIRNVLHHLSIDETSVLIAQLNENLRPPVEVYIQDMELLSRSERLRAGWHGDLFQGMLQRLGIPCDELGERSRKGTRWFWCVMRPTGATLHTDEVRAAVVAARTRQKGRLQEALLTIARDFTKTGDYAFVSHEFSNLNVILGDDGNTPRRELALPTLGLPLTTTRQPYDHAVETHAAMSGESALAAILSRKTILDFPKLIARCQGFLYFAGYSQRSLFATDANKDAVRRLLDAGREVKVLVVDAESEVAKLRAREPSYASDTDFFDDIAFTVEEARKFSESLHPDQRKRFSLRKSTRVPACSYFLLDDLCFVSLYARRLSGSQAPCLVFRATPTAISSYYQFMREDFSAVYTEATHVLGGD